MARPYDFEQSTLKEARLRQYGRCAYCKKSLKAVLEDGHHVVPNQSGDSKTPAHDWLRTALNCVILCDICHYRVHDGGRYKNGAVPLPSGYKHSHAEDKVAHLRWAKDLDRRAGLLFGPKVKPK
jgi:hypothetical protein